MHFVKQDSHVFIIQGTIYMSATLKTYRIFNIYNKCNVEFLVAAASNPSQLFS